MGAGGPGGHPRAAAGIRQYPDATSPPSRKSQEFLARWRLHGAGLTVEKFCSAYGFPVQSYRRWRIRVQGFAETFDRIREEHARGDFQKETQQLGQFGLQEDEAAFLRHYRESGSKVHALGQVNWSGADYATAMKGSVFAQELQSITQELMLQVEDTVFTKAREGSLGHQRLFLEQADPARYATKGKAKAAPPAGSAAIQAKRAEHWADRFGATRPADPPQDTQESDDEPEPGMAPN